MMHSPSKPVYRIQSVARVYADVNGEQEEGVDPFENYQIEFDDIERYELISPIGSGKYSTVFYGRADRCRPCAVKILKNIPFIKIQKEVALLKMVSNLPHAVNTYGIVKDQLTQTISIVFEYQESEPPRTLYPKLSLDEIRHFMFDLLTSLDAAHSKGIMHRDVKPGNILISKKNHNLKLIDWGLADLYYKGKAYSVRVSTMRYKAPELLLGYQYYDYGVDIWGAGCVFAEMLVKFPFFEGRDINEMVTDVANVCGSTAVLQYIDKFGLQLPQDARSQFPTGQTSGWKKTIQGIRAHKMDEHAIDLMKLLLTVDHTERITAAEALAHPFFDSIRNNAQ